MADQIREPAQKFAEQHGCTAYDSVAALLADPQIHAVSVCTPSGAHMEPAVAVAEAGKHVVVEKPLEVTIRTVALGTT